MDSEHRHMVDCLDKVCLALNSRNLPAAEDALGDFIRLLHDHFASEEAILERMGGSDADHHIQVHRMTADLVEELRIAILHDRDLARAEHLAADLVTQWIRRLFHEDAALAERVKALGVSPGCG